MSEKRERLGYLGPQGTHSEAAVLYLCQAIERCGQPVPELVPYGEIYDVLQAVDDGEVDSGLVPVENSLEGSINITLDILAHSEQEHVIARELVWPVRNNLLARSCETTVTRIFSHPQPISQCRSYLQQHQPQAELVKTASTARAAQIVAEAPADSGWAAIGTVRAAQLLGLEVIARDIQDNMANATRFFEVRRRDHAAGLPLLPYEKMVVICQLASNEAGALCGVLEEFARRHVNLNRIESRPARTRLGTYIFFFDLETNSAPEGIAPALEALKGHTAWLKDLGRFPVITAQRE